MANSQTDTSLAASFSHVSLESDSRQHTPPLRAPSITITTKFTAFHYDEVNPSGNGVVRYDSVTGTKLVPHADLWFEDGSLICQAENILFRVHRSILARHSVCFQNMFSMPQSTTDSGFPDVTFKGTDGERTPVIFLHDTAEDVGNLLTALYDIDGPYVTLNCHS